MTELLKKFALKVTNTLNGALGDNVYGTGGVR